MLSNHFSVNVDRSRMAPIFCYKEYSHEKLDNLVNVN